MLYVLLQDGYFHFQTGFGMGCFFFNLFHGRVGLEITGFGTGLQFFCLSIQGFWTWTGKNFVKNKP
jgi:hypothetical protein